MEREREMERDGEKKAVVSEDLPSLELTRSRQSNHRDWQPLWTV